MKVRLEADHAPGTGVVLKGTVCDVKPEELTLDMTPMDAEAKMALDALWQSARGQNCVWGMIEAEDPHGENAPAPKLSRSSGSSS